MKTKLDQSLEFLLRAYKDGTYDEESMFKVLLDNLNTEFLIGRLDGLAYAINLFTKK
jgi:hypothetical protein